MKKTFTLLVAVLLTSAAAFAQYGQGDRDRDYGYNGHSNNRGGGKFYFFTAKERDMQIAQINREYAGKIQAVKNKFFMMRNVKEKQIRALKQQRDSEISAVWLKYNDKRNKGDGRNGRW